MDSVKENPATVSFPAVWEEGCLPGPNGDWIFTRAYINRRLGISFTTLRGWISDPDNPLPNYGADCQGALIYASDLFPYIKTRGPNTKAERTREFHAKRKRSARKKES